MVAGELIGPKADTTVRVGKSARETGRMMDLRAPKLMSVT